MPVGFDGVDEVLVQVVEAYRALPDGEGFEARRTWRVPQQLRTYACLFITKQC